ncbi:MAG: M24 family metallopeptidase, partial [Lautropia sp.]|nr:M24 family metallopeptidase [Lautropia sp.]
GSPAVAGRCGGAKPPARAAVPKAAAPRTAGARRRKGTAAAEANGKPWRRLLPGMVLTLEPGIYVRAADDVPKSSHDIGIRIEDDALVTETGCELITSDVPKAAADIEALMAEGAATRRAHKLPA